MKQLWDDPWAELMNNYKPGTVVDDATVISVTDFGAFVRIVEGIEGLIPISEIPGNATVTKGDKVKAEISNVDSMDRRVTLSMRNPGESPEAEQLTVMRRESQGKGATLGDVLKEKLESMKKTPSVAPPPPGDEK